MRPHHKLRGEDTTGPTLGATATAARRSTIGFVSKPPLPRYLTLLTIVCACACACVCACDTVCLCLCLCVCVCVRVRARVCMLARVKKIHQMEVVLTNTNFFFGVPGLGLGRGVGVGPGLWVGVAVETGLRVRSGVWAGVGLEVGMEAGVMVWVRAWDVFSASSPVWPTSSHICRTPRSVLVFPLQRHTHLHTFPPLPTFDHTPDIDMVHLPDAVHFSDAFSVHPWLPAYASCAGSILRAFCSRCPSAFPSLLQSDNFDYKPFEHTVYIVLLCWSTPLRFVRDSHTYPPHRTLFHSPACARIPGMDNLHPHPSHRCL